MAMKRTQREIMFKFSLVDFSIRRPKLVVWGTVALTLLFLTQFPRIRTDTNPKNMLPETSEVPKQDSMGMD